MDTVNILKAEGFKFPTLKESDAMFSADTAPEWADGEVCHRCRVAFSLIVRRHHCRACGQVFCQQCSSKTSTLPKFGIEKEVRVCDACYDKVSRPPTSSAKLEIVDTSNDYGPTQPQKRQGKSAEELQEEEELQLALALSQSEAEHKEKERTKSRLHVAPESSLGASLHPTVSPSPSSVSASPEHGHGGGGAGAPASSELSRYLDRSYWEQRVTRDAAAAPTAPLSHPSHDVAEDTYVKPATSKTQEDDAEDKEIDEFVETLKSQVEIFVNRMKSNSSRGRSIANDTSVQTLFMNITAMHSRLLRYIQQQDDKRVYLESLQDKVAQVRDSRAALDTLRAEHAARLAQAAEAAERQRQMQMAAKLHAMRKKKHEYLQYQRQLALQRVQEQEREMQMRQEQQKHQYMMSSGSGYYMPGVNMHQFQPGFPNQQMYANPQFHPQMMPQSTADNTNIPGQPQMSQANISMPAATISQSMPQMTNAFAMSTSGMTMTQAPVSAQQSMNLQNIRPGMSLLPMQQQMLMQQMHQMRLPVQPGAHQLIPQNMINGNPGQNVQPGTQSVQQLTKNNLPNQSQQPGALMPSMSIGQQNLTQPLVNSTNPMVGMQLPNMRLPMMQNQANVNQQVPTSGYQMNIQNQPSSQLPGSQMPNVQVPGQPMTMSSQQMMQGQPLHGQSHTVVPNNNIPNQGAQAPQQLQHQNQHPSIMNQPSTVQGQHNIPLPGQQMHMQGQPGQQNVPQGIMNQNQHLQNQQSQMATHHMHNVLQQQGQIPQMQQLAHNPQLPQNQAPEQTQGHQLPTGHQIPASHQMTTGQQMLPGQQIVQQGQMPQMQQIPQGVHHAPPGQHNMPPGQNMSQIQQMPQGQIIPQGQQMQQGQQTSNMQPTPTPTLKIQQQNIINSQGQQQTPNQPPPLTQTPVKSEHNNNTSELISFD